MVANVVTSTVDPTSIKNVLDSKMPRIYEIDNSMQQGQYSLRSAFQDVAETIEQVMIRYGQPEQINQTSNLIGRRLKDDRRPHLAHYLIECLDDRFIEKLDQSSIQSVREQTDLPVHCSTKIERFVTALKELGAIDPVELGRDGTIECAYHLFKASHKLEEFAEDNHIQLVDPAGNENQVDKNNNDSDQEYDDKISRPSALVPVDDAILRVDEESYELGTKYVAALTKWIEDQNTTNHSQTLEQAIAMRDMWLGRLRMIKQINDRKSRRTMVDWAQILNAQSERGGTGASSFSKRIVTDPNTGQPMIDPKSLQPVQREITKEQIDARGPKYASELEQIISATPLEYIQQVRYVEITSGLGDWRANAAEDKLSRQA